MTDDLEFYTRTATEGSIYGLGVGSTPGQWDIELGGDYLDDARKGSMRRDYGLIEISFQRVRGGWSCFAISIQVHRLAWSDDLTPERLRREYGTFRAHVPFVELSTRIRRVEFALVEIEDPAMRGFEAHRVASTPSSLYVVRALVGDDGPHKPGDVWSIAVAGPRRS